MLTRFRTIVLALVVLALLAGCAQPTPTPVPAPTKAPAAAPAATVAPAPTAAPAPTKVPEPTKAPAPTTAAVPTKAVEPTKPPTAVPTLTPAPGKTKIVFWYSLGGATGKVIEAMVDKFNKTSATIQVEAVYQGAYADIAQKLTTAVTANTLPEVAQMGGAPYLADSGALVPVTELMSAADRADIYPAFWDYNAFKGQIVTMPFNNSVPMLFYNKDLFSAAGLDPNKPPATWDELLAAAKALTKDTNNDGKTDQWGFNTHTDTHWYLSAMIMQNGGKILSDDGKKVLYNGAEGVEALKFWGDLVTVNKVMPANQHATARADFMAGKVGMLMQSSAQLAAAEKDAKFKVGIAGLPCKKVCSVPIGGASLIVFKTTAARQKLAWEFVQWMTNAENTVDLFVQTGYVPIRKSAASAAALKDYYAKSPNAETTVKQLQYASTIPVFMELGNSDEQLRKAVEKVELGTAPAKDAMDAAATLINKNLAAP